MIQPFLGLAGGRRSCDSACSRPKQRSAELSFRPFSAKPEDGEAVLQPFHGQTRRRRSCDSAKSRPYLRTAELCFNPFTAKPEDGGAVIQPVYDQTRGRRRCDSAFSRPSRRTVELCFTLFTANPEYGGAGPTLQEDSSMQLVSRAYSSTRPFSAARFRGLPHQEAHQCNPYQGPAHH